MDEWGKILQKKGANIIAFVLLLIGCLTPFSSRAYHPMSTDDPGTTEFRHFEVESGMDLVVDEKDISSVPGYSLLHIGLAPGLEVGFMATYNFWGDLDVGQISGWADSKLYWKYRFLGDGDGPSNLGVEMNFTLPSGDSDKGLSIGDTVLSNAIVFATAGKGPVRVLFNVGSTFAPDFRTIYLAGVGLEYTPKDKLSLVGEVYGYSDFNQVDDHRVEWLETLAGFYWSPKDWFNLSAGDSFGLMGDAPQNRLTVAVHFLW